MTTETIEKLNQYHIKFAKTVDGRKNLIGNDYIAGYIAAWGYWATPEDIDSFVGDINKCLNNTYDFDNEDTTSYSIHTFSTELASNGLKFFHKNANGIVERVTILPLLDLKILLQAWRDFLVFG